MLKPGSGLPSELGSLLSTDAQRPFGPAVTLASLREVSSHMPLGALREATLAELGTRVRAAINVIEREDELTREAVDLGRERISLIALVDRDAAFEERQSRLPVIPTNSLLELSKEGLFKFLAEASKRLGTPVALYLDAASASDDIRGTLIRPGFEVANTARSLRIYEFSSHAEEQSGIPFQLNKPHHDQHDDGSFDEMFQRFCGHALAYLGHPETRDPLSAEEIERLEIPKWIADSEDALAPWAVMKQQRDREESETRRQERSLHADRLADIATRLGEIEEASASLAGLRELSAPVLAKVSDPAELLKLQERIEQRQQQGRPGREHFAWERHTPKLLGRYPHVLTFNGSPLLRVEPGRDISVCVSERVREAGSWVPVSIGHLTANGFVPYRDRDGIQVALPILRELELVNPGDCVDIHGLPVGPRLSRFISAQSLKPANTIPREIEHSGNGTHSETPNRSPRSWGQDYLEALKPSHEPIPLLTIGGPSREQTLYRFGRVLVVEAGEQPFSTRVYVLSESEAQLEDVTDSKAWEALQRPISEVGRETPKPEGFGGTVIHRREEGQTIERSRWAANLHALLVKYGAVNRDGELISAEPLQDLK